MSIETVLGIVGALLVVAGSTVYMKIKRARVKLAGFGIVVVGIVLIAIAIVGLPA